MRPTGVTILSILYALSGVGGVIGGFISFNPLAIALGLLDFAIAYGLWRGQNWSRILVMIFSIFGIIGGAGMILAPTFVLMMPIPKHLVGVFSTILIVAGAVAIILNLVILLYLTRPHVKAFFEEKF